MVDAIGSSTTDWTRALDDDPDEVRRRAAASATTKVATAPPEVPQQADVNGALLLRAAQAQQAKGAASPKPLLAMGIDASAAARPDQDTAVQKRMDAFFAKAAPTYRIPWQGGTTVELAVATPFRMKGPTTAPRDAPPTILQFVAQETRVVKNTKELQDIAGSLGIGTQSVREIQVGRGTPSQVHALTQALLDAGKLPPAAKDESTSVRVRRMMCDYGIGLDCAGYSQQALLAAHGITRAQVGLDHDVTNESLSNLSRAHFARVAPEDARAGDVLALGPPRGDTVGHRLVVFERHEASAEELQRYRAVSQGGSLGTGRVTVLSVDSSFGSNGDPAQGGVQRQTWLYDGKQWGTVIPAQVDGQGNMTPERVRVHALPYDGHHPLIGVFHYRGGT